MEATYKDHNNVIRFVEDYLSSVDIEDMDISNKRKTLKARVKNLAADYKFPKDFANYISLFLLVTKFIYVEDQTWKVNRDLVNRIKNDDFLFDNLFKFLFFTRDYNEYYKSPLVFNTPFANNDFELANKRKSIVNTLYSFCDEEVVSFDNLYKTLTTRYAFFRDYNDPEKFYYSKGEVFNNKQFIFLFVFKTLSYLDIVNVLAKGNSVQECKFKITEHGKRILNSLYNKEEIVKTTVRPYRYKSTPQKDNVYKYVFTSESMLNHGTYRLEAKLETLNQATSAVKGDFLRNIKQGIAKRAREENVPNLLV
ncbi:MAG: hypothetical protein PHF25_02775 [Candidatus Margulisbacteria bacterium]|nr:hypothetical protein [Candidatus Margulisiibacteriota bacterium]